MENFGKIDVLVNTAALLRACPLEDLPLDEWRETIDINITGYFLISQRYAREMIKQGKGNLIHISTMLQYFQKYIQQHIAQQKLQLI